jgi:hypothetical protein
MLRGRVSIHGLKHTETCCAQHALRTMIAAQSSLILAEMTSPHILTFGLSVSSDTVGTGLQSSAFALRHVAARLVA